MRLTIIVLFLFISPLLVAQEKPLKVVVFFNTECPICQKMTLSLNHIQEEFIDAPVTFYAYFTDKKIKKKEIVSFQKTYDFTWNSGIDRKLRETKKYGVTVTPEVVLIDDTNTIRYQGAIDNWFYEWGKNRLEPTEFYLKKAIEAVLAGEKVQPKQTDAIGCWIEF